MNSLFTITHFSFRMVPTFGLDTIRKFNNNVSGMKQLAARDFEDILQVCSDLLLIYQLLTIRFIVHYSYL